MGLGLVNDGVLLAKMIVTVLVGTANAGQKHLGARPNSPFAYVKIICMFWVLPQHCNSGFLKKKVNKVPFIEMMRLFAYGYRILATPNVCCMVLSQKTCVFSSTFGAQTDFIGPNIWPKTPMLPDSKRRTCPQTHSLRGDTSFQLNLLRG